MIVDNNLQGGEWVCSEKVHGSNFSFWYNLETGLKVGSRTQFTDSSFKSCHKVIAKYERDVRHVYDLLIEDKLIDERDTIALYGEIFGGNFYGHQTKGSKCVQAGVSYTPDTEFILFDILLVKKEEEEKEKAMERDIDVDGVKPLNFLSYQKMMSVIEPTAFKATPFIYKGTLEEALAVNETFETLIPDLFGVSLPLPDSSKGKHCIAEGFVIRPYDGEKFLNDGTRVSIKKKTVHFCEHNGQKVSSSSSSKKGGSDFDIETQKNFEHFTTYLCGNRLNAVLSKIDNEGKSFTFKDIRRLTDLLVLDAVEDFQKDTFSTRNGELFQFVETTQKKKFETQAKKVATEIVRDYLKDQLKK
eukprot:Awhi_evm1s1597